MICLGILGQLGKVLSSLQQPDMFFGYAERAYVRFCMFLLFCSSFGEMGTFHLVHFVSMEGLVHFTSS